MIRPTWGLRIMATGAYVTGESANTTAPGSRPTNQSSQSATRSSRVKVSSVRRLQEGRNRLSRRW